MATIKIKNLANPIKANLFDYATFKNPDLDVQDFYEQELPIVSIDIRCIKKEFIPSDMTSSDLQYYIDLQEHEETKFCIVANNKLIDGVEKIAASKAHKKFNVLGVDLSKFIDIDDPQNIYICDANYKSCEPKVPFEVLDELEEEIITLKNGKKVRFEYHQNTARTFNRGFVTQKISAVSIDDFETLENGEKRPLEVGYMKISYIDESFWDKYYENHFLSIINFKQAFQGLSGNIFDFSGNFVGDHITNESVKDIQWGLFSSVNYQEANDEQKVLDRIGENHSCLILKLKEYISKINNVSYLKRDAYKENAITPLIDYISAGEGSITDDNNDIIKQFQRVGLGLELYKRGAQWMGLNNKNLRAGLLNDKSRYIWENKLSKDENFNYKEIPYTDYSKYGEPIQKFMKTIVRYDGKAKIEQKNKNNKIRKQRLHS